MNEIDIYSALESENKRIFKSDNDKAPISYRLAIIIPCWKCAKEIAEMLDSIILQTFQEWQVFCIDDQSPDNTLQTLLEYSKKDQRIHFKIRDREPKGAQTCRNIGLDLSVGAEYVIWFDADDIISPLCFEQRVAYMEKHSDLDFAIFPAKTFKNEIWDLYPGKCYGFPFFEDSLEAMLTWTLTMVGWTNIYRRSSLVSIGHKWDENILSMQDSDFNIQGLIKNLKFDYAVKEGAKVDYFHRIEQNKSSVSHGIHSIPHFCSHIYLLTKITDSLSMEQKKKYKKNIQIYFLSFAEIIKNDPNSFSRFLNIPWVKRNFLFFIRLKIWKLFRFRMGHRLIFRDVYNLRRKIWGFWKNQMKMKTQEIIIQNNNYSSPLLSKNSSMNSADNNRSYS